MSLLSLLAVQEVQETLTQDTTGTASGFEFFHSKAGTECPSVPPASTLPQAIDLDEAIQAHT